MTRGHQLLSHKPRDPQIAIPLHSHLRYSTLKNMTKAKSHTYLSVNIKSFFNDAKKLEKLYHSSPTIFKGPY